MSIVKAWSKVLGRSQNVQATLNMLATVDGLHARVHYGEAFSHTEKHTVPSSDSIDHLIVTNSQSVHLGVYDFNSTAGPADIYLYENPFTDVNSLGTESIWKNRSRGSAIVSSCTLWSDPFIDVNSLGDELDYKLIESTAGGPVKQAGGTSVGLSEWILPPNNEYLIRFYNNDGANSAIIQSTFLMYIPGLGD